MERAEGMTGIDAAGQTSAPTKEKRCRGRRRKKKEIGLIQAGTDRDPVSS
jgi:hypothetical protein